MNEKKAKIILKLLNLISKNYISQKREKVLTLGRFRTRDDVDYKTMLVISAYLFKTD